MKEKESAEMHEITVFQNNGKKVEKSA